MERGKTDDRNLLQLLYVSPIVAASGTGGGKIRMTGSGELRVCEITI